jgi:superfamily II DNA/RNA helicase
LQNGPANDDSSEELLKGIRNMNFRQPSKVQEKALPLLLMNPPTNMIAQSQSGTGKTAAFSLNILSRVDLSNPEPQALALAPSRELARQILGVITHMGQFMDGLKTMAAIPDPSRRGQKFDAQVLVGTPGTVQDMLRRRLINSDSIKILVLDEADNMLDQQGMGEQCTRVKSLLKNKELQTVLFSATFPPNVIAYAKRFAPKANTLTLAHEELTIEGIKQLYIDIDQDTDKYATLLKFYGLMTQASSIIFVRTRRTAEELEKRMVSEGHKVAQLSGALEGPERDRIIDQFRSGEAKVLITTNVLARGIDVQSVTMVINYVSYIPEKRYTKHTNVSLGCSHHGQRNRRRPRNIPPPHRSYWSFRTCRCRSHLCPRQEQLDTTKLHRKLFQDGPIPHRHGGLGQCRRYHPEDSQVFASGQDYGGDDEVDHRIEMVGRAGQEQKVSQTF